MGYLLPLRAIEKKVDLPIGNECMVLNISFEIVGKFLSKGETSNLATVQHAAKCVKAICDYGGSFA